MRCGEARKLLSLRLDEPPSGPAAQLLTEHLSACGSCRQYAHLLDQLPHMLGIAEELEPPVTFATAVMERVRKGHAAPTTSAARSPSPATQRLLAALTTLTLVVATAGAFVNPLFGLDISPSLLTVRLLGTALDLADSLLTLADIAGTLLPVVLARDPATVLRDAAAWVALTLALWAIAIWPRTRGRRVA